MPPRSGAAAGYPNVHRRQGVGSLLPIKIARFPCFGRHWRQTMQFPKRAPFPADCLSCPVRLTKGEPPLFLRLVWNRDFCFPGCDIPSGESSLELSRFASWTGRVARAQSALVAERRGEAMASTRKRALSIEQLETRQCLAASLGWDGVGQGAAALNYYIGAAPSGLIKPSGGGNDDPGGTRRLGGCHEHHVCPGSHPGSRGFTGLRFPAARREWRDACASILPGRRESRVHRGERAIRRGRVLGGRQQPWQPRL